MHAIDGLDLELVPAPSGGTSGATLAADSLIDAVAGCLALRGWAKSPAVIRAGLAPGEIGDAAALVRALAQLGVTAQWRAPAGLPDDVLPVVVVDAEGLASVAGDAAALASAAHVLLLAVPAARDGRADGLVAADAPGWFWPVLWSYRRYFAEAAALSAVVNLLSLAGIIFMMTVYDRILPNQAYVTLWSLAIGVGLAMLLEFAARTIRGHVLDSAGKKIDLVLGDAVFGRVLGTRLEHRAGSTGAFANVLKEFEAVRAFVTSATLTAVADLPFALLFLLITAIIAGPLVWVPVIAFIVVIALSLAIQVPLARAAGATLREGAVRHGTIVESLEGLETIKALRAEARMRRRHETASAMIAETAITSQALSNLVLNLTIMVQQVAGAALLIWGVYLAATGEVTAGALVAAVQLNSRTLAPLVTLSSLAVRFQQSRTAMQSLDRIMALPLEREPGAVLVSGSEWQGGMAVRDVSFAYEAELPPVLAGVTLDIRPGERVAILGRMGSGKSTLLRLLTGLYRPRSGQILLDGIDIATIEPADLRTAIMLVGQDARLFHGTLRDNLKLAAPGVDDAALLAVAAATGVTDIAAAHPRGLDRPIGERGDTLSGGQRQAVALARAMLARPRVLLLDEPTAGMDQRSEAQALKALAALPRETTLIIVTHKQAIIPHVDRIIVLDGGRIVANGPKADVLAALGEGRVREAA